MKSIKTYKIFTVIIILLFFSSNLSTGILQNKLRQVKQGSEEENITLNSSGFFSGKYDLLIIAPSRFKLPLLLLVNHKNKIGTPTMGGCIILPVIMISAFLWGELNNIYVWLIIYILFCFGLIGFIDDFLKMVRKNSHGLRVKAKLSLQVLAAFSVAITLYLYPGFDSYLNVPFFKNVTPDLGLWYIPFAVFIIVGSSNAVNLTDGLDGLAIGPIIIAFISYLTFSYFSGHTKIASYLQIPYIAGSGELSVLCGSIVGAGLGFLWYNTYPAQMFMGDTGSVSLGAALGAVAIMTKQEILLAIVGGLFVLETLSVIFQVASFKLRRKRIFRMAPLHHHFELKGWAEPKVIVRFWIITIFLALLAFSTLKLR